jgi:hypothetical protein
MAIKELDTVVLTRDMPQHGLEAGDIGAVVHCYKGSKAIEVEFVTGEGGTVALITLHASDVRTMSEKEILHVRELKAA